MGQVLAICAVSVLSVELALTKPYKPFSTLSPIKPNASPETLNPKTAYLHPCRSNPSRHWAAPPCRHPTVWPLRFGTSHGRRGLTIPFCNTFYLHLGISGLENQFLVFFLSGRLRQVLLSIMSLERETKVKIAGPQCVLT